MKIDVQDVNAAQKRIEVTVTAKEVDKRLEEQYKEVMRTANIRGFRPGKAPRNLIERHYGDSVRGQVSADLVEEQIKKVLEKEKINPVAPPQWNPENLKKARIFPLWPISRCFQGSNSVNTRVSR